MSVFGKGENFTILSEVTREEEEWLLGKELAQERRDQEQKKAAEQARVKQIELEQAEINKKQLEEQKVESIEEMVELNSVQPVKAENKVLSPVNEVVSRSLSQEQLKIDQVESNLVEEAKDEKVKNEAQNIEILEQKMDKVAVQGQKMDLIQEVSSGKEETQPLNLQNSENLCQNVVPQNTKSVKKNRRNKPKSPKYEPENLFQPEYFQNDSKEYISKKKKSVKKSKNSRPKTGKSTKKGKSKPAKQLTQAENYENQQKKMHKNLQKTIKKEKSELKQQMDELRQNEEELPEDDGYLDDIMQYEEENWNKIDIRDSMIATLVQQQRIFKTMPTPVNRSSTVKKARKNKNYDFQRLKKSIERQNYMKTAKNFDSTLRLDFDEVRTLNSLKKDYNPYPDYNEPLVNKGVKFLTLDDPKKSPMHRKKSKTQIRHPPATPGGRNFPKIPRIDHQTTLEYKNTRPIFKVRRPLSTKYNPDRKKYLQRNMTRDQMKKNRSMKRYQSTNDILYGSGLKSTKRRYRPKKMVGFDDVARNRSNRLRAQRKKLASRAVRIDFFRGDFDRFQNQMRQSESGFRVSTQKKFGTYQATRIMPVLQKTMNRQDAGGLNPNLV